MSHQNINQRRRSLRPVPNREQEQFQKDLKQLEQLQNLNYDMNVLIDMMDYKISMTEESVMAACNEVVGLIAFKGLAVMQNAANELAQNREAGNDLIQQRESNGPRPRQRPESSEQESKKQKTESQNSCEDEWALVQILRYMKKKTENKDKKQPQKQEKNYPEADPQQKTKIVKNQPQKEPIQVQKGQNRAQNHQSPNDRQLLKAFKHHQPTLYKQLMTNKLLQNSILSEMNNSIDQANTMSLTLRLNMRSSNPQKRSQAFEVMHKLDRFKPLLTDRTEVMFEFPFVEVVSLELKERILKEQKIKQREKIRGEGIRQVRESESENERELDSDEEAELVRAFGCEIF